jgi:hypothetical protein
MNTKKVVFAKLFSKEANKISMAKARRMKFGMLQELEDWMGLYMSYKENLNENLVEFKYALSGAYSWENRIVASYDDLATAKEKMDYLIADLKFLAQNAGLEESDFPALQKAEQMLESFEAIEGEQMDARDALITIGQILR